MAKPLTQSQAKHVTQSHVSKTVDVTDVNNVNMAKPVTQSKAKHVTQSHVSETVDVTDVNAQQNVTKVNSTKPVTQSHVSETVDVTDVNAQQNVTKVNSTKPVTQSHVSKTVDVTDVNNVNMAKPVTQSQAKHVTQSHVSKAVAVADVNAQQNVTKVNPTKHVTQSHVSKTVDVTDVNAQQNITKVNSTKPVTQSHVSKTVDVTDVNAKPVTQSHVSETVDVNAQQNVTKVNSTKPVLVGNSDVSQSNEANTRKMYHCEVKQSFAQASIVHDVTNRKNVTVKHNQSRPTMTDQQREINSRTVFVAGERDQLIKLYKHKPRLLNKEIIEQAGGQIDKVYLTKNGTLRIIACTNAQKDKLMKLNHLDNKPVKVSLPYN